jgi:hypothetical protein
VPWSNPTAAKLSSREAIFTSAMLFSLPLPRILTLSTPPASENSSLSRSQLQTSRFRFETCRVTEGWLIDRDLWVVNLSKMPCYL